MACIYCQDEGYWVCEPNVEAPSCNFVAPTGKDAAPPTLVYLGRHQIRKGKWTVWRRANAVCISDCAPSPSNGGQWTDAGCLDFPEDADYDVWRTNGNRLKIAKSEDTNCSQCP